MSNKHIPPAVGEFAVGERDQLLARIAEQAREIERLRMQLDSDKLRKMVAEARAELAALKAQPSGVVLPPHCTDRAIPVKYRKGWNCCISEVARLNSSPVRAGEPVYRFQCREIGEGDWEPCDHSHYLYCQKSPEMDTRVAQVQALSAPSQGGGVAHTDCRSEDGITVGLIDSIITSCRVLSSRDLTCEAVVEALRDLRSDSDVSLIKPIHGEQVREVGPDYKRKFEYLVEHAKRQDQVISELRYDENIRRFYDDGAVWFWAGDETDNLETLACPVVINAGDLRALLSAAPSAGSQEQE